jgi:hypothetical protein
MIADIDLAPDSSRGERNRNPGNINFDPKVQWMGQIGLEQVPIGKTYPARFARFEHDVFGVRAIAKLLHTYITVDGCTSVEKVVTRWAPQSDGNIPANYIAFVCKDSGLTATGPLTADAPNLVKLVSKIIVEENGRCLYSDALIAQAVEFALAA